MGSPSRFSDVDFDICRVGYVAARRSNTRSRFTVFVMCKWQAEGAEETFVW